MNIQRQVTTLLFLGAAAMGAVSAQSQTDPAAPAASTPAASTTVVIQASNRGWLCDAVNTPCAVRGQPGAVQATGPANAQADIFAGSVRVPNTAGQTLDAGVYRNWFQFQIPKLAGPLLSATLALPDRIRWNGADLQYTIYGLSAQPKVFKDIHGVSYGTVTTTDYDFGQLVTLRFNAYGLAAIEGAQGGSLFLGGIDSGEVVLGYHGDFSVTNPAAGTSPFPNPDANSPLTLTIGDPNSNVSVDSTCTTAPPKLNSFWIEHVIDLTKIQTSLVPNVPNSFGPVFAGTAEARDRITYDATTGIMNNEVILVPPGSSYPTPPSVDWPATRLVYLVVPVDRVMISCQPRPSVMVSGTAVDGFPLFGNPAGAPVSFAFGYSMDSPAKVRDVVNVVGGVATVWEATVPYARLDFATVFADIAGMPNITTTSPMLTLDGSQSTGGPLTYSWSTTGYGMGIVSPNAPKTEVFLGAGGRDYSVTLTVRNLASGQQSTATATIHYTPAQ